MRRFRLILFILFGLLSAAAFLPQLPPVRSWLLARLQTTLAANGIDLAFQQAAGNPWRGLDLAQVKLLAPGLDLETDRLRLRYFLPALVTGELPLRLDLGALSGRVDPTLLGGGPGGGGLRIRPTLRSVSTGDVRLDVVGNPYTLPDFTLRDFSAHGVGKVIEIGGRLETADGSAAVAATLQQQPLELQVVVSEADAIIARHWWKGIEAGILSGTIDVAGGGVTIRGRLESGQLDFLDSKVQDVHGDFRLASGIVLAELEGRTWGGLVQATGGVDISGRNWWAEATARPELLQAATWLARGRIPGDLSWLPLDGTGDLAVTASGWQQPTVSGSLRGQGYLGEAVLRELVATFDLRPDRGLELQATALLGDGSLAARILPRQGGSAIEVVALELPLPGLRLHRLSGEFLQAGVLSGRALADLGVEAAGKHLRVDTEAVVDPDGWQVFFAGHDERGAPLQGAAVLRAGELSGQLELDGAILPLSSNPATVQLRADGPLSSLDLSLGIAADEPVLLGFGLLTTDLDLRGRVNGTLSSEGLRLTETTFPGFRLSGTVPVAGTGQGLSVSLESLRFSGPVSGELRGLQGDLRRTPEGFAHAGTVSARLEAGPVELPFFEVRTRWSQGGTLDLATAGDTLLQARVGPDGLTLDVTLLGAVVGGRSLPLQGRLEARRSTGGTTVVEGELRSEAPDLEVMLSGDGEGVDLALSGRPGFTLLGRTLAETVAARTRAHLESGEWQVELDARDMSARASGRFVQGALEASGRIDALGESLQVAWEGPFATPDRLLVQGSLPTLPLARLTGLAVSGMLQADLVRSDGRSTGQLSLSLAEGPLTGTLALHEREGELALEADLLVLGIETRVEGPLTPAPALAITTSHGSGRLDGLQLSGDGILPELGFGPVAIAERPVSVHGDLAARRGTIATPGSRLDLDFSGASPRLDLVLDEQVALLGRAVTVRGTARGNGFPQGVSLDLTVASSEPEALVLISGPLEDLGIEGTLVPATLPSFPSGLLSTEPVRIRGQADLLGPPDYHLEATWTAEEHRLDAVLDGRGPTWQASLRVPGLEASGDPGTLRVEAAAFTPEPFLRHPEVVPQLTGQLTWDRRAGTFTGELALTLEGAVTSTLGLRGEGATLLLEGSAGHALGSLQLAGVLLPDLDLAVAAASTDGLVTAALDLSDRSGALQLDGTLLTGAWSLADGLVELPSQRLSFSSDLLAGEAVLEGESGRVEASLTEDRIVGQVVLALGIGSADHRLEASLDGLLSTPALRGSITGPLVEGAFDLTGGTGSWELRADVPAGQLGGLGAPAWVPGLQAELLGRLRSWSGWSVDATLRESEPSRLPPMILALQLTGEGSAYEGRADLVQTDTQAPIAMAGLRGLGGDLELAGQWLDGELALLAAYLPWPLEARSTGSFEIRTAPTPSATVVFESSGKMADRPFALSLTGGTETFRVDLQLAGVRVEVEPGPDGYGLSVRGADPVAAELRGLLALQPSPRLQLDGSLAGRPANLDATFDPETGSGRVDLTAAGARFQGSLSLLGEDIEVSWEAGAEEGNMLVGLPLQSQGVARLSQGTLAVSRFTLSGQLPRPASLSLSGPAWPQTDLAGELLLAGEVPERVRVLVQRQAEGVLFTFAYDDLRFYLRTAGPELAAATLRGTGPLPAIAGRTVRLDDTELRWTREAGFAGGGRASLEESALAAIATLHFSGEGRLQLSPRFELQGTELLTGSLLLSERPWEDPALEGLLDLQVDSGMLPPSLPDPGFRLHAGARIGGTLATPRVAGEVVLDGATRAEGTFEWTPPTGRMALEGPSLALEGTWSGSSWQVDGTIRELDLGWLPADLPAVRASGRANARGSWPGSQGPPLEATVEDLLLETALSRLRGTLNLGRRIAFEGTLEADLREIPGSGDRLTGSLSGPVGFSAIPNDLAAGSVEASLRIGALQAGGLEGSLEGSLDLTGSLADPEVSLLVDGQSPASGRLEVTLAPARREFRAIGDLAIGPVRSALEASLTRESISAAGELTVAGRTFSLNAEEGGFLLRGTGPAAGWEARVDPASGRTDLSGNLSSLTPALTGTVMLELDPASAGESWLRGRAEQVRLAGRDLGPVQIRSSGLELVRLSAPGIEAQLFPTAGLGWDLTVSALPLGRDLLLDMTGTGGPRSGELAATLSGSLLDQGLELSATGGFASGVVTVDLTGELLGGRAQAAVALSGDSGWSGTIALQQLTWQGVEATLSGTLQGAAERPRADLATSVQGPGFSITGTLAAEPGAVAFEQLGRSSLLAEPITVSGSLLPVPEITLSSAEQTLVLSSSSPVGTPVLDQVISATGSLGLSLGPVELALTGHPGRGIDLQLQASAPAGFGLGSTLTESSLAGILGQLGDRGWAWQGEGSASGTIRILVAQGLAIQVEEFSYRREGFDVSIEGEAAQQGGWVGRFAGSIGIRDLPGGATVAGIADGARHPYTVAIEGERIHVESRGPAGELRLQREAGTGRWVLDADLAPAGAELTGSLELAPGEGLGGSLLIRQLAVQPVPNLPTLRLDGLLEGRGGSLAAALVLEGTEGGVSGDVSWGLGDVLPPSWIPRPDRTRQVALRVSSLDLQTIPVLAGLLPHLSGNVSGVVQLRDRTLFGSLVVPDLGVEGTLLPTSLNLEGSLTDVTIQGSVGDSTVTISADPEALEAFVRLESFPLETAAEAVAGESDTSASVTGVLRARLPWSAPLAGELRLATERVRLERFGVVTAGNVTLDYLGGTLTLRQAVFEGAGRWTASGVVAPDRLELSVDASDADFSPLLSFFPPLARYGAAAQGSLTITGSGSLVDPRIELTSEDFAFSIAGGSYRLQGARVLVQQGTFEASGDLLAETPVQGRVRLEGRGGLSLVPAAFGPSTLTISGRASIPILGEVEGLEGTLTLTGASPPGLDLAGTLGNPFTIEGTLVPLSLRARGQELTLSAPQFLLATSTADVDLELRQDRGFHLGGSVLARNARFQLGIRPPPSGEGPQPPNPLLEQILFDDLVLRADQQVQIAESLASAEAAFDLRLSGSAGSPELSGSARALRGSITFSGRDFDLRTATAEFEPARGIYPRLHMVATTTFDKRRVLSATTSDLRFVAPRDSNEFVVELSFSGEIDPPRPGDSSFRFDLSPVLSSPALVEQQGNGLAAGPRSLTQAELLSLVTLGRIDPTAAITGEQSIGATVAETALETALDLLILSELQDAISEALGVEVVELRTSAVSTLIEGGSGGPFSVSLLLGGYLRDDLFASFRIGSFDDANQTYALTNRFTLSYNLGPLAVDLTGGLNIPEARSLAPVPQVGVALRYQLTPDTGLTAGMELTRERQQVNFGVTFSW